MLAIAPLAAILAFAQVPATASTAPDSAAIVGELQKRVADFLWVWRFYWEASEAARHEISGDIFAPQVRRMRFGSDRVMRDRISHLHCHPDGAGSYASLPTTIREDERSLRAVCPNWAPRHPSGFDEREAIDNALIVPLRSGTTLGRAELLHELERGADRLPGDGWIAGQRVRFAIDQRDNRGAMQAAEECRAARWWCASLVGYVRFLNGDISVADSIFEAANGAIPLDDRCKWTDLRALLDEAGFDAYSRVPCAKRDSVNARIWWLSDPLYTETRNERRAEHFARMVMISLRGAVMPAERWNWIDGDGGSSLRSMLLEYGWPNEAWWAGPSEDASHYGYLGIRDERTRSLGVFTTMEYNAPGFHTVPRWAAIADPPRAPAEAWDIAAPINSNGEVQLEWWPREHYARRTGELLPIAEAQVALLRRRDSIQLAVATDLGRVPLERVTSRMATASLIVTPAPDTLRFATKNVSVESTAVWQTSVLPRGAIVGVEAKPAASASMVARMRFGIDPPQPLSTMHKGDIAISMPVLVRPPTTDTAPISDPNSALDGMLGTTILRGVQKIGVYWETYGIAAGDSVDVALRIERLASPGVLRRLGTVLRVADPLGGSVTVRWTEPRPGSVTTTLNGVIPIQGRNVSVDLSQLVPDKYSVTVSVTRGGRIVSAMREFEIRAK